MAQGARETIGTRARWTWTRERFRARTWVTIGGWGVLCLLLIPAGNAAAASRSAAELIPDNSRFFLEVDLQALREHGPQETVPRAESALAALASESGLSAERLRTVVMASGDEPLNGDRLPAWLLFTQAGEPPPLSKLENVFRRYTRAPLKPGSLHGLSYRGNSDLSLMQLPDGPTLVAGAAGPAEIIAAWQGSAQSRTPLVRSARAELLQRVSGDRAPAFRVWLALTSAMQRSLVEDAHVPAAPLEVASALRLLPERSAELWVLTRCSDEDTAKRLAAWLSARLTALATSQEMQLLGLGSYLQASRVASDGALMRVQLPIGATELAALSERAIGMLTSLAPHPAPALPAASSSARPAAKKVRPGASQASDRAAGSAKAKPAGAAK